MIRYKQIKQFEKDLLPFLLESTFSIDKDIDFIYNNIFKTFIIDLFNNKYAFYNSIKKQFLNKKLEYFMSNEDILFDVINSNQLKSKDSKNANTLNSLNIYCGIFNSGNCYQPKVSSIKYPYIQLSVNRRAVYSFFNAYKGTERDSKYIDSYLNSKYIKSTIAHELSHWIDDSLHKGFLTSLVDLAEWLDKEDILLLKHKDINLSYFEINAQIHGIKNLKRLNKKEWNRWNLKNLFWNYSTLMNIAEELNRKYDEKILFIWQKYLMKRMARENLLGKNMRTFIKYNDLKEAKVFRI